MWTIAVLTILFTLIRGSSSSYLPVTESRAPTAQIPSASYPFPLSTQLPSGYSPSTARVIRSCAHHDVGLIFLEACNKNHKRSPFAINIIFMQYFMMPPPEHDDGHRDTMAKEQEPPNPVMSTIIIAPKTEDVGPNNSQAHLSSSNSNKRVPRMVPAMAASIHPLIEKCCSVTGCVANDFSALC